MTNTSNTPDPRIEAAAAAMWEQRPMMRTADGAPRPWAEVPAWSYGARYREQARVALAAADAVDPRKPRTITTVEELDALSVGSVIRADNGEVFEKQADGPYCDGPHDWQSFEGTFWNGETFVFPITVLHEPEAEATR